MSLVYKNVKRGRYMYYAYYVDGKKVEKYCGPAGRPESGLKALRFELEDLEGQKAALADRIAEVKGRIAGAGRR